MSFKKIAKNCFIIFTVLTAVLYTLHAFSPYIKESNSSLYVILNIGYVLTLIAYIIITLIWLFISRKIFFILFILFFAGYKNFFSTVALNIPSEFKMEKDSTTLRVMSWNVKEFFPEDGHAVSILRDVLDQMILYNADVVCMQDVTSHPIYVKLIDEVQEAGYSHYFFAKYLRTFNRKKEDYSDYGVLILSKYPFSPDKIQVSTLSALPEYLAFADILIKNKNVRIYNTHFESMSLMPTQSETKSPSVSSKIQNLKTYKSIHTQQAEFVKNELNKSPYPLIFCGDLNSVPSSYVYHHLRQGLNDVFVEKGFGLDGTYNRIAFPKPRIDVMLTSKELKIKQYKRFVIDKKLSDHYPIVADISF